VKKSTPRPENEWERVESAELQIIADELWEAAHQRLRAARRFYMRANGGRPASVLASGKYLLTGLGSCGALRPADGAVCGGAMIVRSRASGAGRRFVYSCGYHHTRGGSVCGNALLAPMEATDRAVLDTIDHDVLNPRVLTRAAEHAIAALCPPADAVEERRAAVLAQVQRLQAELERLAEAIAGGGDVPALVRAAKDREAQRARCAHELAALESSRRLGRVERARIDRQVREVLTDWQGFLPRHTPQAREILRNLLEGRLIFTPEPKSHVYTFSGQAALGRLLTGAIPAYSGVFNSVGGPNGIRTRVSALRGRTHSEG